ncbi:phage regulatory protein/antirepressor Ant [uncultured Dysgonomonas sp.]|uniref:Phage antirepressor protein n=1 Tax=uncultured Dysgonomonas sp. TaxID=206096 RepID=A0A212IWX4_9BACT|nr:phage regulatory protein/antirepressor Ant [uncultured Dysgonomonas sp.]SBV91708.1 Phage antirepressor protein [uncultured Dysgonomonas sp.]
MNNLVFNQNGAALTNSLLVAEKFGKRHDHVLRDIKNLIDSTQNWGQLFVSTTYTDNSGKSNPMYIMNRDGFTLLAMGFTGKKALEFKLQYIEAFNKMESALINKFTLPQSFSEALRLAAEQAETIEKQQLQIETQKPKVLFADAVEMSDNSCLIGELAKILKQNGVEIGQNRLFEWMRYNGYLCTRGELYNQPSQSAMELGLFELIKRTINNPDGSVRTTCTTKVTGKGQIYFVEKFLRKKSA